MDDARADLIHDASNFFKLQEKSRPIQSPAYKKSTLQPCDGLNWPYITTKNKSSLGTPFYWPPYRMTAFVSIRHVGGDAGWMDVSGWRPDGS